MQQEYAFLLTILKMALYTYYSKQDRPNLEYYWTVEDCVQ